MNEQKLETEFVTLEWYECEQAMIVGARREIEIMRAKIMTQPFSEEPSVYNHIQSAGAEKSVGKRLNVDWHASINTFKLGVADVGSAIEVRYRRKEYDLKVSKDDDDSRFFVLVWGEMPTYEIVGWLRGKDAKQPQFWSNPGGHGFAYFVPAKYLRPVSELKVSRVSLDV